MLASGRGGHGRARNWFQDQKISTGGQSAMLLLPAQTKVPPAATKGPEKHLLRASEYVKGLGLCFPYHRVRRRDLRASTEVSTWDVWIPSSNKAIVRRNKMRNASYDVGLFQERKHEEPPMSDVLPLAPHSPPCCHSQRSCFRSGGRHEQIILGCRPRSRSCKNWYTDGVGAITPSRRILKSNCRQ